jgi:hypothetical protein
MTRRKPWLVVFILALSLAAAPKVPPLFVTSDRCVACHNGIVTQSGEEVSIGTAWASSMMANASRDPYWQASIRRETLDRPAAGAAIEHECAACHMPMARYMAKAAGGRGRVFAYLPVTHQVSGAGLLAADGVSCAMCHQVGAENLGRPESYTAGFVVDTTSQPGSRRIFGPFDIDAGRVSLMRSSAGFRPEKAAHIQSSELCASCHTLYTHALNEKAEVVGTLPEQVPYLEWKHSAYSGVRTCQSCHMPVVEGETPITGIVGKPRQGFSRHVFRGGNFFIPRILGSQRDALGVTASALEMETGSFRTARHLETEAAEVTVLGGGVKNGVLGVEVTVANLAGHKLPSAYPSRRAWVHLTMRDGSGNLIFESGRLNPDGSIAGNDNDEDGSRFEPHHTEIGRGDDVQIYESILAGPGGEVTTGLLTAIRYAKDNRLLPEGFDRAAADQDISVKGRAAEDADFQGGGDRTRYAVRIGNAGGPFEVRAELIYQPISYRWARNLGLQPSAESDRFVSFYKASSGNTAVVLSRAALTVESP